MTTVEPGCQVHMLMGKRAAIKLGASNPGAFVKLVTPINCMTPSARAHMDSFN